MKNYENYNKLNRLFAKTERDVLSLLGYHRTQHGFVTDYESRLYKIKLKFDDTIEKSWDLSNKVIKERFSEKELNSEQKKIINDMQLDFMGRLIKATENVNRNLADAYNMSYNQEQEKQNLSFLKKINKSGLVALVDTGQKKWQFSNYMAMVMRTAAKQAEIFSSLYADADNDLYRVSSHNTTCRICAPFEGRIFSRSGKSKYYPNMTLLFGKINKSGADTADNTYLCIHPNCLHFLIPFTEAGKTKKEIQQVRKFSSFESNPIKQDVRTKTDIQNYRLLEEQRRKSTYEKKVFRQYKVLLGNKIPKMFETFKKYKDLNDERYKKWAVDYQKMLDKVKGANNN